MARQIVPGPGAPPDNSVSTAKIVNLAVTEGKVATDAITSTKIAAGAVDSSELATGSVIEAKLGTGAVTADKIGSGAVTETKIGASSVTNAKIANGSVSNDKIAAGALRNSLWSSDYENYLEKDKIENLGNEQIIIASSGVYTTSLKWKGRGYVTLSGMTGTLDFQATPAFDTESGDYPYNTGDTVTIVNDSAQDVIFYDSNVLPGSGLKFLYHPQVFVLHAACTVTFTRVAVAGGLWVCTDATQAPAVTLKAASGTSALPPSANNSALIGIAGSGPHPLTYTSLDGDWRATGCFGQSSKEINFGMSPYTTTAEAQVYFVNCMSGNVSITLEDSLGVFFEPPGGRVVTFISMFAHGGNTITISPSAGGGSGINGAGSYTGLAAQYNAVTLASAGDNRWFIVSER